MPSTLSWLDHDAEARDRMHRVLALFEERDTMDELGLGAIRDSFSDLLFPGTSTIQTRLRYFLIVPWLYRHLEDEGVPSSQVVQRARDMELDISASLMAADPDQEGIFGRTAGRSLKTLPSAIYWAGMATWGIRRFNGTRARYHQVMDLLHRRRAALADADEARDGAHGVTWDPALPAAPDDFPGVPTLELRRAESEYLQDRVGHSCRGSLMAELFLRHNEMGGDAPWEHPAAGSFPAPIQVLLRQARLFAGAMHGAALLYNLLLSRAAGRETRIADYEEALGRWRSDLDVGELARWNRDELWQAADQSTHRITPQARRFVESWIDLVVDRDGRVAGDLEAERLVRSRERLMKGARSRLENTRLLEQWGGASGADRFTYRWSDVTTLCTDLYRGLGA
jgi:hypothetical protein